MRTRDNERPGVERLRCTRLVVTSCSAHIYFAPACQPPAPAGRRAMVPRWRRCRSSTGGQITHDADSLSWDLMSRPRRKSDQFDALPMPSSAQRATTSGDIGLLVARQQAASAARPSNAPAPPFGRKRAASGHQRRTPISRRPIQMPCALRDPTTPKCKDHSSASRSAATNADTWG
jgi:hypothetical protein